MTQALIRKGWGRFISKKTNNPVREKMKKINRHKVARCTGPITLEYDTYGPNKYTGYHGYGAPEFIDQNSRDIGGSVGVEIEMAFNSYDGRQHFTESVESNVIWCGHDGSITGVADMEMCTIPLLPGDAISPAFWKPICERLLECGARSYRNNSTGLHVHLDRKLFHKTQSARPNSNSYEITCARALYGLYVQDAPWKKTLFGRSNNNYCVKNIGGDVLKFVQTTLPEAVHSKECVSKLIQESTNGMRERYSEFNCTKSNTIEFRCGKGTLKPERIAAIAEFCIIFAKYCRAYGKKMAATSQKHFDSFVLRHAKKHSMLQQIFKSTEEE